MSVLLAFKGHHVSYTENWVVVRFSILNGLNIGAAEPAVTLGQFEISEFHKAYELAEEQALKYFHEHDNAYSVSQLSITGCQEGPFGLVVHEHKHSTGNTPATYFLILRQRKEL